MVGSRNNSVDSVEVVGEFISEAADQIHVYCGLSPRCREWFQHDRIRRFLHSILGIDFLTPFNTLLSILLVSLKIKTKAFAFLLCASVTSPFTAGRDLVKS